MQSNNFDEKIERHNTWSTKFDCAKMFNIPETAIPMWVADMDFRCPECVKDALSKVAESNLYGYSSPDSSYVEAVIGWFNKQYGWAPKADWLVKTTGVCVALAHSVRAYTEPHDAVLITSPVYYPFANAIRNNGRTIVDSELVLENGRYHIDFKDFENKIASCRVKMFILCNPHNPVGRVWTVEELQTIGKICHKYHVTVISDEIHCDITYPGHTYTPYLKANPELADETVVCTAPSKTFNLAGLQASNIWIPNDAKRKSFKSELDASGLGMVNLYGLAACKAAYLGGEEWHKECMAYIQNNLSFIREYLKKELPEIVLIEPEGTYFAWVDCSALGFATGEELDQFMAEKAGLWLDGGRLFGESGAQFERIVLACQKSTLEKALLQLKEAVQMHMKKD